MYHKVYDPAQPPEGALSDANSISSAALEEELQYLVEEGYYFPTWQEVRDYVDDKGDDPYALPRVRVSGSPSMESFRWLIGER